MGKVTQTGGWNPTRPRGPIGAHFSSPGPKYLLPGSIGYEHHDLRKERGPAYTFGCRHKSYIDDCSPGPAYMVPAHVTKSGVDGTPKYSVYGRLRSTAIFKNPGPGAYSPEKSGNAAYRSAPSYTLSGRIKSTSTSKSPGPAAYCLKSMLGEKTPSYSITGKGNAGNIFDKKTPGPGSYSVVHPNVYKHKDPFYSMTGRNAIPTDSTLKPGPGSHSPEKVNATRVSAPSYTFGMRHSEFAGSLIVDPLD